MPAAVNYIQNIRMRQALYALKKEYGFTIDIYQLVDSATDVRTGVRSVSSTCTRIRRAIVLPSKVERVAQHQIPQVVANREFVMGGTYDASTRTFIIDRRDAPGMPELSLDDWIVFNNRKYEIKQLQAFEYDAGWLIVGREMIGEVPEQQLTLKVSDFAEFSDAAVTDASIYVFVTEDLGIGDPLDISFDPPGRITQAISLTDALSLIHDSLATPLENLGISDEALGAINGDSAESVREALGLVGTPVASAILNVSASTIAGFAVSAAGHRDVFGSPTDSVGFSDVTTFAQDNHQLLTDSLGVTDVANINIFVTLSASLGITDSAAAQLNVVGAGTDLFSFNDTASGTRNVTGTGSTTASLHDAATGNRDAQAAGISLFSFNDAASGHRNVTGTASDTASLTGTATGGRFVTESLSQSLGLSDTASETRTTGQPNVYFSTSTSSLNYDLTGGGSETTILSGSSTDASHFGIAADSTRSPQKVFFINSNAIKTVNADGSGLTTVITPSLHPTDLDVDPTNGYVYYACTTTGSSGSINRMNYDGTGQTTLSTAVPSPLAIALDLVNSFIYVVSSSDFKIYRFNLDGSGQATVLTETAQVFNTGGLCVDPANSVGYYTYISGSTYKVKKFTLSTGVTPTQIYTTTTQQLGALDIDRVDQTLLMIQSAIGLIRMTTAGASVTTVDSFNSFGSGCAVAN